MVIRCAKQGGRVLIRMVMPSAAEATMFLLAEACSLAAATEVILALISSAAAATRFDLCDICPVPLNICRAILEKPALESPSLQALALFPEINPFLFLNTACYEIQRTRLRACSTKAFSFWAGSLNLLKNTMAAMI